jgi:hypothetical protein
MTLNACTKLGRYEIRSKIGEGGMGEVYLDFRSRRRTGAWSGPAMSGLLW